MNSKQTPQKDRLRELPSVDKLLLDFDDAIDEFGHKAATNALRKVLDDRRARIVSGDSSETDAVTLRSSALAILKTSAAHGLRRVFNLTGTVLHTNLGRAILPTEAIDAIRMAASREATGKPM